MRPLEQACKTLLNGACSLLSKIAVPPNKFGSRIQPYVVSCVSLRQRAMIRWYEALLCVQCVYSSLLLLLCYMLDLADVLCAKYDCVHCIAGAVRLVAVVHSERSVASLMFAALCSSFTNWRDECPWRRAFMHLLLICTTLCADGQMIKSKRFRSSFTLCLFS